MNLVVLGATGRTGRLVVEQALAAGHTVTALVRSPQKLTVANPNLRVVAGEATDRSALARALEGADAVISALGGGGSVIADSTAAIVAAGRQTGVSRVVVLSSWVVERDRMDAVTRLLTGIAMGPVIKDKSAGEQALRRSDLEWTSIQPPQRRDHRLISGQQKLLIGRLSRMNQRNTKLTTTILWVLAAAYAVALVANIAFQLSIPIALVLLLSVVFALIHGAVRYGWSGIAVFIAVCLVVSNILENTSILTGFPFGHYHYTDLLGPKLFLVPLLIGPAYFANGYFAWVIGNVLIGEVRRGASAFTTFAVPFIASFLFALFIRFRPGGNDTARTWPRSHYVQAIVMYAAIGLTPVLTFLVGGSNSPIADAAGAVWQTRSIAESVATVSLYTMIFAVVLSTMKLFQPSEG